MKRMKEKARRFMKYWRVRYRQADGHERLYMGLFMLMVAYLWWVLVLPGF